MYDPKKLEEFRQALKCWEETNLQQSLAQIPERQDQFITTSSEPVKGLYTPLDVAGLDFLNDLGLPGEYPYTRGIHPTLHRGRLWTMRMFAGFAPALVERLNAGVEILTTYFHHSVAQTRFYYV